MTHESAPYFDGGCKKHQLSFPCIDCEIDRLRPYLAALERKSSELHYQMQAQREAAKTIQVMTRNEVRGLMESQAQAAFGTSAGLALKAIRKGELPNTLTAPHLEMLNSLLKYGAK